MAKKRKETKGVSYIAVRILQKYQPSYFPTKKIALVKAREVLNTLKAEKRQVTVRSVLSITRKKTGQKKKKDSAPELSSDLYQPSDYFELVDYPNRIAVSSNRIYFRSKISKSSLPMLRGGEEVENEYELYFSQIVNYFNRMASMITDPERKYKSGYEDWLIRCTEPKLEGKIYVSEIISCDIEGNEFLYGFDADKGDILSSDVIKKSKEQSTPKTQEQPSPSGSESIDKEIELVKQKRELLREQEESLKKKMEMIRELKSFGFSNEEIASMMTPK